MKEKTSKFTHIKIYICIINDTANKVKSLPQTGSYEKYLTGKTWNPEYILNAYTSVRRRGTTQWQKHNHKNGWRK